MMLHNKLVNVSMKLRKVSDAKVTEADLFMHLSRDFSFSRFEKSEKKMSGKSFLSNSVQIHRSNSNRSGSLIHSNKTSLVTKCFSSNCSTL